MQWVLCSYLHEIKPLSVTTNSNIKKQILLKIKKQTNSQ